MSIQPLYRPFLLLLWLTTTILVNSSPGQDTQTNAFGLSQESTKPVSGVVNKAGLFSPDAIKKAIGELERIEKTYKFATIVETVETLRGAKIVEETEKRARASGVNGIYLLIDKDSHLFESNVSPIFRPAIPAPARSAIRDAILADFKKREFDTGLASAISVIEKTLAKAKTEGTLPAVVSPGDHASTMVVHNQIRLTLAGARRIIEGAETKATALGVKENIAVVNDGGHLLAFSRMDGARPASIATALTKATMPPPIAKRPARNPRERLIRICS